MACGAICGDFCLIFVLFSLSSLSFVPSRTFIISHHDDFCAWENQLSPLFCGSAFLLRKLSHSNALRSLFKFPTLPKFLCFLPHYILRMSLSGARGYAFTPQSHVPLYPYIPLYRHLPYVARTGRLPGFRPRRLGPCARLVIALIVLLPL